MASIHVDVVSAEEQIFSGEAKFVALPGESGELGILPQHTPLITRIKPGAVRIELADGGEEFVFVAGGISDIDFAAAQGEFAAMAAQIAALRKFRKK
jgi:F-type H+-transporting ATPase subunit epsilon